MDSSIVHSGPELANHMMVICQCVTLSFENQRPCFPLISDSTSNTSTNKKLNTLT